MGYVTVAEHPAGVYRLDVYLPELHAAVEYDGPGHGWKRDAVRDQWLWQTFYLPVLRIRTTDEETLKGELTSFFRYLEQLGETRVRRQCARENGWHG